jgi:putative selenium metabolism hydrolase
MSINYISESELLRSDIAVALREIISIPSLSTMEGAVAQFLVDTANRLGAITTSIDPAGTFIARFGSGKRTIIFDSHIDTVDVGDLEEWKRNPFDPFMEKSATGDIIHGRGASDNKAGIISMLFGASQWQRLNESQVFSIYVVGSVQEESCDGLALYEVLTGGLIPSPELVVLGEATTNKVYRGNRGRIEAYLRIHGQSCHASAPERGDNPITNIAPLITEIDRLNRSLRSDSFLGAGTVVVSKIECETPSLNAVPGSATLYVDRRLSMEETPESALQELRSIASSLNLIADIEVLNYESTSYTGLNLSQPKEFNTWVTDEDSVFVQAALQSTQDTRRPSTETGHWVFSTNGVASMGKLGIPTIGYGPADEFHAHTAHDQCPVDDLVEAIAWYSSFPTKLAGMS